MQHFHFNETKLTHAHMLADIFANFCGFVQQDEYLQTDFAIF
jgi:hypothetical protein